MADSYTHKTFLDLHVPTCRFRNLLGVYEYVINNGRTCIQWHYKILHPIYKEETFKNVQEVAEELRKDIMEYYDEKAACDTAVSCDVRQSRGFAPLNQCLKWKMLSK